MILRVTSTEFINPIKHAYFEFLYMLLCFTRISQGSVITDSTLNLWYDIYSLDIYLGAIYGLQTLVDSVRTTSLGM